jgi:hypothetical protein
MSTITTFDLARFTRAAEERDAATQLSMYRPDAVVTINNKISQPGAPRVLRTREQHLQVMRHGGLGEVKQRHELAHAHRLSCTEQRAVNASTRSAFEWASEASDHRSGGRSNTRLAADLKASL